MSMEIPGHDRDLDNKNHQATVRHLTIYEEFSFTLPQPYWEVWGFLFLAGETMEMQDVSGV